MISPSTQYNLKNAVGYFDEHLAIGDYYGESNRVVGEWFGVGAERLGLRGGVTKEPFVELCAGNHPQTKTGLTLRLNTVRKGEGGWEPNRRIFYDFVVSPPKSVSVMALMRDTRIVALHAHAVRIALGELERCAETRVRVANANDSRKVSNVAAACFQHETSRELDPQLHTHCVIFNATFDAVENRWKALHNAGMLRARRYVESVYDHELCRGLAALGYTLRHSTRSFEIATVPPAVIERFSKRHRQIDAATEKWIASEAPTNIAAIRQHVAHSTRKRKGIGSTAAQLSAHWESQLAEDEKKHLQKPGSISAGLGSSPDLGRLLDFADADLFERQATVMEHAVLAKALARGRGQDFDLVSLRAAMENRNYVRSDTGDQLTSLESLRRELAMVTIARQGCGAHNPYAAKFDVSESGATGEQLRAIEGILGSRDFVTVFAGGAGTGKSFTLRAVDRLLHSAGHSVAVLAPQRQQVEGLSRDGFTAETLSSFLNSPRMEPGGVVIVDEAGQVGARQMLELFKKVQAFSGRVILSGDVRQHGPVEASDALRALQAHAKISPIFLRSIKRQNPDLAESRKERQSIATYRSAVKAASAGEMVRSFEALHRLGNIHEVDRSEIGGRVFDAYLAATTQRRSALIVTQTRESVRALNEAIAERLAASGLVADRRMLSACTALDLTEAAKTDPGSYATCTHLYFTQRYGRFARGDLVPVLGCDEKGLRLIKDGRHSRVGFKYAKKFLAVREERIQVGVGSRLQIRFNGKSVEGRKISNGELVTVRQITPEGCLCVEDTHGCTKTLGVSQRLFGLGYAVTSYGSQGKTVDVVIFADAGSSGATNMNQWYVTISRGRREAIVITPDKAQLRRQIGATADRPLAIELGGRPMPVVRRSNAVQEKERIRHYYAMQRHMKSKQSAAKSPRPSLAVGVRL